LKNYFIFIIWLPWLLIAQKSQKQILKEISRLEKQLKGSEEPGAAEIQLKLSELYWKVDTQKAVKYGKSAIKIFEKNQNPKVANALVNTAVAFYYRGNMDSVIAYAQKVTPDKFPELSARKKGVVYNILMIAYKNKGEQDKALPYARKALENFRIAGDSLRLAWVLDNISNIYLQKGDYKTSLNYTLQSLRIFEKLNSPYDIALANSNIAVLYGHMQKYDLEKKQLFKVLQYVRQTGDKYFEAETYNNLGSSYLNSGQIDSAYYYHTEALQFYKQAKVPSGIAISHQNLGLISIEKKEWEKGIAQLQKAYELFKELDSKKDLVDTANNLATALMHTGDLQGAKQYLKEARNLNAQIQYADLQLKTLKNFSEFYRKNRQYDSAFVYQNRYYQLKDSLNNIQAQKQIAELEKKYQSEKKEKQINLLKNEKKWQQIRMRNLSIFSGSILLLMLASGYLFFQKRKKEKALALLEKEKISLQNRQLEQELNFVKRQLAAYAINIMHRNKMLNHFLKILSDSEKTKDAIQLKKLISKLKKDIKQTLNADLQWEKFEGIFAKINPGFIKKFGALSPQITENDFRMASLIKLGMSNKEIASVFNISPQSVKNNMYRLKKKIGLDNGTSLRSFIMKM